MKLLDFLKYKNGDKVDMAEFHTLVVKELIAQRKVIQWNYWCNTNQYTAPKKIIELNDDWENEEK